MPLVRIDLVQGKSAEYRRAIGGVVYEAMVDVLKAPTDDRFQVIAEYPADALIADENYLGNQAHSRLRHYSTGYCCTHCDHPQLVDYSNRPIDGGRRRHAKLP
jgi:phenylpyruvate tautomerase PptA (4-oxalocrotonate tautomerase family)